MMIINVIQLRERESGWSEERDQKSAQTCLSWFIAIPETGKLKVQIASSICNNRMQIVDIIQAKGRKRPEWYIKRSLSALARVSFDMFTKSIYLWSIYSKFLLLLALWLFVVRVVGRGRCKCQDKDVVAVA